MEMIKFEHTVFALPFAYLGAVLAPGRWSWGVAAWVTVAMVAARTAGMCFNRLIDRQIDAKNPRTSRRALVTGAFSPILTFRLGVASLVLMALAAAALNPLCFLLSPMAVLMLVVYHYLKRLTWLCHFGIGAVLACAPVGGWAAAAGTFSVATFALGAAVLFWTAGFDIFYSMQDTEFDRREGLHSLPAQFGAEIAMLSARACHVLTLLFLIALGIMLQLSPLYWVGLVLAAAILVTEHILMAKDPKKYVQTAFFTLNGALSIVFFAVTALSVRS